MQENPFKVPRYCRYCQNLERIDAKDALGRDYKQNYCRVKESIYSDNTIKRASYCEFYVKGEDVLEDPKPKKKKKEKSGLSLCVHCNELKKGVSKGSCAGCRDKVPLVREIRAMGRAFLNGK